MSGIKNPTENEKVLARSFVLRHFQKIAEKDEILAEKDTLIREKDMQIREKDVLIREKDMQIGNLTLKSDAAISNLSRVEGEKVNPFFLLDRSLKKKYGKIWVGRVISVGRLNS